MYPLWCLETERTRSHRDCHQTRAGVLTARRVQEHHDAGTDHVAVMVATDDYTQLSREQWRALAPALV